MVSLLKHLIQFLAYHAGTREAPEGKPAAIYITNRED